jgi:hypothetical protein
MWWEYGKGMKLVNLEQVVSIFKCYDKKEDTIGMIDIQGRVMYFTYESLEDACEAYQYLRMKLLSGDDVKVEQLQVDLSHYPFNMIGGDE